MASTAERDDSAPPTRTILVDGFNVLHTVLMKDDRPDGWWKSEQRERLLARVAGWRGGADEIWVAFDGSRPDESVWTKPSAGDDGPRHAGGEGDDESDESDKSHGGSDGEESGTALATPAPTVRRLFTESADDWIVRRARKAEDPTRIIVVSADRQVAGRAKSAGVEVLSPWSFIAECDDEAAAGDGFERNDGEETHDPG